MDWKQKIDGCMSAICKVMQFIVSVMLVTITLLITLQVVLRAFFNTGVSWIEEVSLILFIYITFFSMTIAMRYDLHLRVELFVSKFGIKAKKCVELLDNLILLWISILMVTVGITITRNGMASIMPATLIFTSVIYLPTPIAGVLCAIQCLLRIFGISGSSAAEQFIGEGAGE